jgi:hypothetical protein
LHPGLAKGGAEKTKLAASRLLVSRLVDDNEKQYRVGEKLHLQGTRSWRGKQFIAEVQDVRLHDNTIKVKYEDGGYKRFTSPELESTLAIAKPMSSANTASTITEAADATTTTGIGTPGKCYYTW